MGTPAHGPGAAITLGLERHGLGHELAITEYNHGGEDHVSGAIAQADTLGIFGREGVHAGAFWSMSSSRAWAHEAWKAFGDYDGAAGASAIRPGRRGPAISRTSRSTRAWTRRTPAGSCWSSVHRPTLGPTGTLDLRSRTVQVSWSHVQALRTARAWQLANWAAPSWASIPAPAPIGSSLVPTLPALSVTTVGLTP